MNAKHYRIKLGLNLILQEFIPYCTSLTKRATLKSSVTGSNLTALKTMEMSRSKIPSISIATEPSVCQLAMNDNSTNVQYFQTSSQNFPGMLIS